MSTIQDIVDVEAVDAHVLRVVFDDGKVREVDHSEQLNGPIFEPLRDPAELARVTVDEETGTVIWPTGADLDPSWSTKDSPAKRSPTEAFSGSDHACRDLSEVLSRAADVCEIPAI